MSTAEDNHALSLTRGPARAQITERDLAAMDRETLTALGAMQAMLDAHAYEVALICRELGIDDPPDTAEPILDAIRAQRADREAWELEAAAHNRTADQLHALRAEAKAVLRELDNLTWSASYDAGYLLLQMGRLAEHLRAALTPTDGIGDAS